MAEQEQEDKKSSSTKALKDFFGFKEGQRLADFAEELKALSPAEKAQLAEGIENGTFTY